MHRSPRAGSCGVGPRQDLECRKEFGPGFLHLHGEGPGPGHTRHSRPHAHALRARHHGRCLYGAVLFRKQRGELNPLSSHKHPENEDQSPDDSPKEQGGAASPESAPAAEGPFAEQLLKLQAENKDLLNTLVRRQADFENYRKRVEKERQTDRHRGVEHLIEKILPVLDALEKALSTDGAGEIAEFRKGFELIYRQLWDVLSKQGLKRIESAGKAFDPHFHHAIQQ